MKAISLLYILLRIIYQNLKYTSIYSNLSVQDKDY